MTVHVVDPGCELATGHNLHMNRAIADACARAGIACRIGANRRADSALREAMPEAWYGFSVGVYDLPARLERGDHLPPYPSATEFARELSYFLDGAAQAGDTVILHTCAFPHLLGLARWISTRSVEGLRFHLILRFEPGRQIPPQAVADVEQATRAGLAALADSPAKERVFLHCDSEPMRALYQSMTELPISRVPMSIAFPSDNEVARLPGPPSDTVRLAFLGEARPEKGYELLARVMLPVLQAHPLVRFLLQVPGLSLESKDLPHTVAQRIEILPRRLDRMAFFHAIANSSAILVPYDPVAYRYRTSHIMVEALGLGRPIIAVRGSWLSEEIDNLPNAGAVLAHGFSEQALFEAIMGYLADQPTIDARAQEQAILWRDRHNLDGLMRALVS